MRTLFAAVAVLLLVSPAVTGDLRKAVVEKIDSMRDDASKRDYRVVLPEKVPEVPRDARLRVEFRLGHYSRGLGRIDFTPGEEAVVVTNLDYGSYLLGMRDLAFRGIGFTYSVGSLQPGAYRELVAKLLLVRAAKLEWKEGRVPESRELSETFSSGDGELHVYLVSGGKTLLSGDLRVPAYDPREVFAKRIDDTGRAILYVALVLEAVEGVQDRMVTDADRTALADALTTELAALGEDEEAFRKRLRIASLGALGHEAAIPAIRANLKHRLLDREAQVAIRKIEILNLEDPKEALEALMNHPIPDLRDWGEAVMRERYAEEYRAAVVALFSSEDPADRVEALAKLRRHAPKDPTLALKGMADPYPRVRVPAATMVWDAERKPECTGILLAVAADKSLTTRFDFWARTGAMEGLTWHGPRGAVEEIRKGLEPIALDETDDVTARGSALLALGYLGDRKAIPTALTVYLSKVPKKPVYLHAAPGWVAEDVIERDLKEYLQGDDVRADAVRTLGILRAKIAVPPMTEFLADAPAEHERNLRSSTARALARIGDPRAREALERWAGRQTGRHGRDWAENLLALFGALTSKDPAKAMLDHLEDGGRWGDPIWIEIALADLADDDRLAELAKGEYGDGLKQAIANARKRRK
jgi:HEAT repeats/PBS lyase HEAT-like repeat